LNPRFDGARAGDHVPDVPAHTGAFYATIGKGDRWDVALGGFGQSRMFDEPEKGRELPDTFFTDAFFVLEATAHYRPTRWLELYVGGQNLLDARYIASRRPFGARPGRPLFVYAGLKLTYEGPPLF
jgi:Fe(3+) dicitrate transport protein